MKLWKSPVLYFGIALILAVAAAFIAPFIIDWGSYRTAIEDYGTKVTGRQMTVSGDISGRLFPWPKLTIRDVKVANPPGSLVPDLIAADEVDMRMTLAGLLGGEIRVETIDVIHPVVAFERLGNGQGSWRLKASAGADDLRLLDHVRLDQITVTDGVVHLIDNRRAGRATIMNVNATLAAQDFAGPWRIRATATYRDRPLEIGINTGSWAPDTPFKFGFRLGSGDGSGLVYQFDGANDGSHVTGELRVQPAASADGRSDAEGQLRPLVMTADVTSDFDTVALDKIEIAPRDGTSEGANLLTGSAEVRLGTTVALKTDLKATRFDLDTIAGAKARGLLREAGGLSFLQNAMRAMPDDVDINASLAVTSLVVGGEALDNATLAFELNREAIRIKELSAVMPGHARGLFTGVFLDTDSGPQLAGDLAGEAGSLRDFVSWAWPEGREDIARIWTGSRGRFKLQTRLDATNGQLRLQDLNYQIDESQGSGGLSIGFGARPSLDVRLDASALDVDRFIPNGVGGGSWLGTAGLFAQWAKGHDLRITLQSGETLINGVDARDVAIDLAAINGNMDIKTIEIGNVGNARLEIAGFLSPTETGSKGSVTTTVKADDPRSLLQLLGLFPKEGDEPVWATALGATDLTVAAELKPDDQGPAANFRLTGKSGDLDIEAMAAMAEHEDILVSELSAAFGVCSAGGTGLAKHIGMRPTQSQGGPGKVSGTLTGSLANGLVGDVEAEVFGARAQFQGKFLRDGGVLTGTGRAGIFADRPADLFLAAGLAEYTGGALSVESDVEVALPKIVLPNIKGFLAGAPVSGSLTLDERNRLKGEFATGSVTFRRLFGLVFMPWDGRPFDSELPFALEPPRGLVGELWIKPESLEVFDGLRVKESQIGISADAGEIRLAAFGKSDEGGDVSIEIGAKPQGGGKVVDGRLVMPINLALSLKDSSGREVATGVAKLSIKAQGSGRTPGAVLASLVGSGSYEISDFGILNLNPERFVDLARTASSGEELTNAFAALASDGRLDFGSVSGIVRIENGTAIMPEIHRTTETIDNDIAPKLELADGRLDAAMHVRLKTLEQQAQIAVTYSGHPNALARFMDTAALESKLGFQVVERTLRELEKLQSDHQKLMEEEDKQRRADEAKIESYNEQRHEMQRRVKEIDIRRRMQVDDQEAYRLEINEVVAKGAAITREEMRRRLREQEARRIIRDREEMENKAKQDAQANNDPTPVTSEPKPPKSDAQSQPLPPEPEFGQPQTTGEQPPPQLDKPETSVDEPLPETEAKSKVKHQPSKAQAKAEPEPGAPLVLVPPQKVGKPPARRPTFLERLFGVDR